jgi:hypothetical protein
MYYIYEVPGVKIGCSEEPDKRVAKQGYTNYVILEEHDCIYKASDRERELQKQKGYFVDIIPYFKSRQQWGSKGGKTQGRKNVESGHLASIRTKESQSKGGKIGGRKAVESGHLASICSKGGKAAVLVGAQSKAGKIGGKATRSLTFGQAQEIRHRFTQLPGGKMQRYNQLCNEYNVSLKVICSIVNNKAYLEP